MWDDNNLLETCFIELLIFFCLYTKFDQNHVFNLLTSSECNLSQIADVLLGIKTSLIQQIWMQKVLIKNVVYYNGLFIEFF